MARASGRYNHRGIRVPLIHAHDEHVCFRRVPYLGHPGARELTIERLGQLPDRFLKFVHHHYPNPAGANSEGLGTQPTLAKADWYPRISLPLTPDYQGQPETLACIYRLDRLALQRDEWSQSPHRTGVGCFSSLICRRADAAATVLSLIASTRSS